MKTLINLTIFFLLTSCDNSPATQSDTERADTTKQLRLIDTTTKSKITLTKLSILVLPPFDEIANEGISPNIQQILEKTISNDTTLTLIQFPYRQLMNVPYQNVFDKKYCKPITDNLQTDIILMTKLDQATRTGKMASDKWNFQIKIYNTKTDKQFLSQMTGDNLTSTEIQNLIKSRRQDLFTEINNNR